MERSVFLFRKEFTRRGGKSAKCATPTPVQRQSNARAARTSDLAPWTLLVCQRKIDNEILPVDRLLQKASAARTDANLARKAHYF